jgi:hypothetical protein
VGIDVSSYREEAEEFTAEISREHYLHLAGRKRELELEPIYERHRRLFERRAVAALREALDRAAGEERRRLRYLTHFAVEGLVGLRVRREAEELARLEASLEVTVDGEAIGYRQVAVRLANEPDSERRAELAAARDEVLAERLNPLHLEAFGRSREVLRDLGWAGPAAAYAELRDLDFEALADRTRALLEATEDGYGLVLGPGLERAGAPPLDRLRRSDLPRFFRAAHLDGPFRSDRMLPALVESLGALGIDLAAQANVTVDAEERPTKTPRAFCSTPRVPFEIYLVIAPLGGRGDFEALFHEAGHAEHYAHVDPRLAFEYRHLGDNAVTESFAFMLERLVAEPAWLGSRVRAPDPAAVAAHERAAKLVMVRRYCAKLAYELELGAADAALDRMPSRYREHLQAATRAEWPAVSWLDDVDSGFYVACYLRAWALEVHWRRALRERFGERWFDSEAAGAWLRELWRAGQRLDAEELLVERLGEELDFGLLAEELTGAAQPPNVPPSAL